MGLPDYHFPINIAIQTLTEILQRPKYGKVLEGFNGLPAVANTQTEILTIVGEGMTYGGYCIVQGAATCSMDSFRLKVDGILLGGCNFFKKDAGGLTQEQACLFNLCRFNNVSFQYAVSIPYGVTFDTELGFWYHETYGRTPSVQVQLNYTLI